MKRPEIAIQYDPRLENAARKISSSYAEIIRTVEKKMGWDAGFVPVVVLVRQNEEFQQFARNRLITAYAVPRKNLIVIDYSKMDRTPFDLRATFEHELYHLLLHEHIESSLLPKWLDEGFVQWASGGVADIINPGNKDLLKQAVLSDTVLPLRTIASRFPAYSRGLLLSYQQSRSFIEYIVQEYGEEKMLAVLNSLKKGKPVEQALMDDLSIELYELELNWRTHLVRKYSWMTYIADHIYWILFSAAAVITILGYLRFRMRLRNYRDEDDEDLNSENIT